MFSADLHCIVSPGIAYFSNCVFLSAVLLIKNFSYSVTCIRRPLNSAVSQDRWPFKMGSQAVLILVRLPRSLYTGSTVQLQLLSTALGFLEAYFHILGCLWLKTVIYVDLVTARELWCICFSQCKYWVVGINFLEPNCSSLFICIIVLLFCVLVTGQSQLVWIQQDTY